MKQILFAVLIFSAVSSLAESAYQMGRYCWRKEYNPQDPYCRDPEPSQPATFNREVAQRNVTEWAQTLPQRLQSAARPDTSSQARCLACEMETRATTAKVDSDERCELEPGRGRDYLPLKKGKAWGDLPWNVKSDDSLIAQELSKSGFRLSETTRAADRILVPGAGEFSSAEWRFVNRGTRQVYKGQINGVDSELHLVFNDKRELKEILVKQPWKNDCRTDKCSLEKIQAAKGMFSLYDGIQKQLRAHFGPQSLQSRKCTHGSINSFSEFAGSSGRASVFFGSEQGFQFSPSYQTMLVTSLRAP
jgi:hypothetical protein